ncbi:MAG TPA: carboxypeptidase regulatory-like domain-containing protein [Candidatus Acidoferrum sp.]|nr:carboxypeptidase regulatory-like domain-containing protein [Candidatus Acidoferrum sp.]
MVSGKSRIRNSIAAWVALAFFSACSPGFPPVSAQEIETAISGEITSASGSRVPNALVTAKNTATGEVRTVIASGDGTYRLTSLRPGMFEVTASAPGFGAARVGVTISAGSDQVANLVLAAAASSPQGGEEQTGSPTVSGVVNSQSVRELPLNGRSASDLAALEAGVTTARTQTSGQGQYGFGTQMTISGGRPRQNDSRLDGISMNDYANGPPGSALGVNLGVDAVEQFKVLTSSYPAQVGLSSGGVIAASTRSGTNDFHGDVFEFLRNSAFDARNFFDRAKPPFRRNQFGASAGGPIWKDHTFIFGDYEGLRQSQGVTQVDTVPSAAARAGNLSTGTIAVDPNVLRFINAFYPLPNGSLLGSGDTGLFSFSGQQVTPENYFTTKLDHKFSNRDTVSGTYMFDSGTVRQLDEFDNKVTGYNSRRQVFTVSDTHTFRPHLLNSIRFGINRVVAGTGLTFVGANSLTSDPTFGTVPGLNAAAVIVPGLTRFSGGLGAPSHFNFHWTTIQGYDDRSWTSGKHALKFGGALERIRDNMFGVSNPTGEFTFNSLSDFLTNAPFSLAASIPSAISGRGIRQTIVGSYVQDDWHWRPSLSISLGLRYEMATVPTEVHGKLTVLRNLTDATPHLGDPLFSNPTLRNFEPRVGFSWDPFRDGKSTVSGGFGIFDVLPLPYLIQFNELFSAPFYKSASATNLPPASFPNGAFAIVAASSNTFRQGYFDPHPDRNYVMQWNLTIQRQLATDSSLRISYVGSRGVHQPFRVEDADIVLPTLTPEGYLWPSPVGSGARLNPNAGRITAGIWEGDSYYDALQVQVKKKIGSGFQLGGSYTWGKTIDTSSGSLVGDEYSNSISSPLSFNTRLNRGLADFNVAHNLEVNYTWDLGTPKWNSRPGRWALGGWQLGGIFEASTGVPFTPGFAGDTLGVGSTDPNIDVPNLLGGSGCGSHVNSGNPTHYIKTQCFSVPVAPTQAFYAANCDPHFAFPFCRNLRGNLGRNTLIGPGLLNFDFSLFKNNYFKKISDAFNVQFRAEFFNILNRTNFSPPLDNRNIFDSAGNPIGNAGLITSTQTPSRQIQFALKLIW